MDLDTEFVTFLKKARSAVRFSVTINITAALISAVIFFNIFAVFQTGLVFALSLWLSHIQTDSERPFIAAFDKNFVERMYWKLLS